MTPKKVPGVSSSFKYIHFPFWENQKEQIFLLDFDGIIDAIADRIGKGEKVMLFCLVPELQSTIVRLDMPAPQPLLHTR